jgi:hypothetical protein
VLDRLKVMRWLLILYFLGSVAVAIPLVLNLAHAGNLSRTTSGKVLAAALIAMGVGALGAARDPWAQRLMIRVLIVFTSLAAVAVVYRLVTERHAHDPAWMVLPFAVAAPALLGYFYPRQELTAAGGGVEREA